MKLTLNIGSGRRAFKEYPKGYKCINFDARDIPEHTDEVGDVRDLSRFEDDMFDYILASDIVEHFTIYEVDDLLKEWIRVLKSGKIIEFRLPNFEAIVTDYLKRKDENRKDRPGVPICDYFSWLVNGGQDYPGNYHHTCYDHRLFKHVCERNGLQEIDWKKDGYNMVTKYRKI